MGEGREKRVHRLYQDRELSPSMVSSEPPTPGRMTLWQLLTKGIPEVSWGPVGSLVHRCQERGRALRYSLDVFWRNCKPGTHDGRQLHPAELEALVRAGPPQALVVTLLSWKQSTSSVSTTAETQRHIQCLTPWWLLHSDWCIGGASHSYRLEFLPLRELTKVLSFTATGITIIVGESLVFKDDEAKVLLWI